MKSRLLFLYCMQILFGGNEGFADSNGTNRIRSDYEIWQLEAEELGMAGWAFERSYANHSYIALQTWMAMQGDRGGFITLGFDGGYRFPVASSLLLDLGLYIGAGGGRGGYHLSGGGLMLRPHIATVWRGWNVADVAVGMSYVSFPNEGSIESVQPYLQVSVPYSHTGNKQASERHFFLSGFHSMAAVGRHISVAGGVKNEVGSEQKDFSLVGIEARAHVANGWYAKLETEGAAQGESTGYMQILGGGGREVLLAPQVILFIEAGIGGAGGGSVSTGGGVLIDGAAGLRWCVFDDYYIGISGGYLHAPDGELSGYTVACKIGYTVQYEDEFEASPGSLKAEPFKKTRIRYSYQHYEKRKENWRSHHPDENVGNVGVQLDTFFTEQLYISGQGFAAANGNAGAYMIGLLGIGFQQAIHQAWFVSAECLVGAAGGGGLQMGSGLVAQWNAGIGIKLSETIGFQGYVGRLKAVEGQFDADIIGLSINSLLIW